MNSPRGDCQGVRSRGASPPWMTRGAQYSLPMAHRGDGRRFIVRAEEKLTAFLELEEF